MKVFYAMGRRGSEAGCTSRTPVKPVTKITAGHGSSHRIAAENRWDMASISSKKIFSENPIAGNRAPRSKTLARAALVFHGGKSSVECIVLDFSETGARLHLLETVWPPNDFILELADGRAFLCETVRQEATMIGVAFLEGLPDRYLH